MKINKHEADGTLHSTDQPQGLKRYSQHEINVDTNRYTDPWLHCDLFFFAHLKTGVEHAY